MSESSNSDHDSEEELELASIYLLMKASQAVVEYSTPLYDKIPYHTSALSGEAWVLELLNGHPKRIRCELGVHKQVFCFLIKELCTMGLKPSRNMTCEEKLSIFLYKCVTGLSVEHVGERFQRSNDTISGYYFLINILIFLNFLSIFKVFFRGSSTLLDTAILYKTCQTTIAPGPHHSIYQKQLKIQSLFRWCHWCHRRHTF